MQENKTRLKMRETMKHREQWPILMPGVYDAGSARLAEQAGYSMISLSGFCTTAMMLGRPDVGFITLSELTYVVSQISKTTSIPMLVDADTGFGNAINVMRTFEELITAGAAAAFIEDQVAPKRCGHVAGKMVVSAEEHAGKIRAADRVRRELDPDFVLVARTDVRSAAGGSIEETIRRGKMYRDAGADIILPEGLQTEEEIGRCGREIGLPMLYNMAGMSPRLPLERLAEYGVLFVALPAIVIQSALRGAWDVLASIQNEGVEAAFRFEEEIKGHKVGNIHSYVGFPEIRKLENEYLPAAEIAARYDKSALGFRYDEEEGK